MGSSAQNQKSTTTQTVTTTNNNTVVQSRGLDAAGITNVLNSALAPLQSSLASHYEGGGATAATSTTSTTSTDQLAKQIAVGVVVSLAVSLLLRK